MAKHHPDLIFCRKQPGVVIVKNIYQENLLQRGYEENLPAANSYFHRSQIKLKKFFDGTIGRLCEKCDGKCVICDSYVRPCTLVRICDECNYGSYQGRCVICGGPGVSDAYYCKECTIQEKDVM
ncbi:PHD finger domain-containing protein [Apis cerana cerana]|uniref:PHD finger domain-containing protein n=1 Tax=Apis cerana cerana TaxID=94128 RepID=A0A2A3E6T8_APICC|nr:PHD finger domain-containing protein [Apis cerana cerana]